jgi:hypothetical protein
VFSPRQFNAAIMVLLTAMPAAAQSLADVARQEEARRTSARKAVRTISNADLDPSAIVSPAGEVPVEPSCYMSKSNGRCVTAEEMVTTSVDGVVTKENAPLEPTWRRDAGEIRSQIEGTHKSMATLEAVIADGGRSPGDRKAAEKTLAGTRQALASLERRWEKLEKEAANQHIPRVWIEPIPALTKNQPGQ